MAWFGSLRSASPGRQLATVLVAFTVLTAVLLIVYFEFVRTPYRALYTDLRTADAATIVAALDKQKIPYRLEDNGRTILVPEAQAATTRLTIAGDELPLKGTVGFELFNKSDMGLTEFAQKINYQRALQGELARTIATVANIESARVHLSLAEPTVFRNDRKLAKASVMVVTQNGAGLPADAVRGIQRLVAAAVPDLDADDIVVLDGGGRVLSVDAPASETPAQPYTEAAAVWRYYSARIAARIDPILQGAVVSVQPVDPATDMPASVPNGGLGERSVPLRIGIATPLLLADGVQAQLRAAVVDAVGSNSGDELSFTVQPPRALPAESRPQVVEEPAFVRANAVERPSDWLLWTVLAGFAAVLCVGLLLRRRPGNVSMSDRQRQDFVVRLKTALAASDANAAL